MSREPLYAKKIIVADDVDLEAGGYFVIRHVPESDASAMHDKVYVLFGPYDTEADADEMAQLIGRPEVISAFFPGIETAGMSVH